MYNFKDLTQHVPLGKALSSTTVAPQQSCPPCNSSNREKNSLTHIYLRGVSAHVVPDSCVIKKTLNLSNSRDSNITVPESPLGKVHDIALANGTDNTLNLFGCESSAGGDDLTSNVFGDGGGTVKRQEDAGLELGLGALDLGG